MIRLKSLLLISTILTCKSLYGSSGEKIKIVEDSTLTALSKKASEMTREGTDLHPEELAKLPVLERNLGELVLAVCEVPNYPREVLLKDDTEKLQGIHEDKGLISDFWTSRNIINFLLDKPESIVTLKQIFNKNLIGDDVWNLLTSISKEKNDQKVSNEYVPKWLEDDSILEELSRASQAIDRLIRDGDTLVGVGNTPQFIIEYHRVHGRTRLNYIQVAISGSPGKPRENHAYWFQSLLTPKALEGYRRYLEDIGFLNITGNVFFMDIIGSAGGPKFLINEYMRSISGKSIHSDVFLLGINAQDKWDSSAFVAGVKCLSLNMTNLASELDKIADDDRLSRVTPHFPSSHWSQSLEAPIIPSGEKAKDFIDRIKKYIPSSIYNERDSDHHNLVESAVFEDRLDIAKDLLSKYPPTFGQVQSILNNLITNSNTIMFCQFLVDNFGARPDLIEITPFDKDHTHKERHLKTLMTTNS